MPPALKGIPLGTRAFQQIHNAACSIDHAALSFYFSKVLKSGRSLFAISAGSSRDHPFAQNQRSTVVLGLSAGVSCRSARR